MRLLISLCLFAFSVSAHAYGNFEFSVSHSKDPGCVSVDSVTTPSDFPEVNGGTVATVRFYFSTKSPDDVTEDSDFQETTFVPGNYENYALAVNEFCGFSEGHYFFKYGLYDSTGKSLDFMSPDDWNEYSHSADIDGK